MSLSGPFLKRPIGTTLLTVGLALVGAVAFAFLPVSPMPQVDFPTIHVSASLPGASPETMASSVATPLERQLGWIAGVTEMTSSSTLGATNITIQFDLNRNIDAAARDVMAAINAARANLPTNLPGNPTYRKANPSDAPILIFALTSDTLGKGALYDAASTILAQKIAQIDGVGEVTVGGSSLPAVRVELNPTALNRQGIGLDDVKTALANANTNLPKGALDDGGRASVLDANDQMFKAVDYQSLVVVYRNGAAVRVGDVGRVVESVENVRNAGYFRGKPAVLLIVFRQPNANIIDTVDRVRALIPQLKAAVPAAIKIDPIMDRTTTIRASVHDVERTLVISVILVIGVVFLFLRDWRTTLIPGVAVPVSLIATFSVMYLCGYSLDNLSLMALTISTGFVVDDAIVVVENVARHLEQGLTPMEAAAKGAKEIGFTVLSMSLSLIAVFIPILMMGGIVGRLFREFAVTLSTAVLVSLVVSLTTTPMMCSRLLRNEKEVKHGRLYQWSERGFEKVVGLYDRALSAVLDHPA
ncbi:MAG TPA: efflux RND transporter permease subunit, partial [Candidatus Methylacidiphilales bacterium]